MKSDLLLVLNRPLCTKIPVAARTLVVLIFSFECRCVMKIKENGNFDCICAASFIFFNYVDLR